MRVPWRRRIAIRSLLVQTLVAFALVSSAAAAPPRPTASFTYSPQAPHVTAPVTFDASASSGGNGPVRSYRWDFGDGAVQTYTTPVVSHTYLLPGAYNVTLTVRGEGGPDNSATATRTVTVSPLPQAPPPTPSPACSDGIDNDGDARVDFPADPGCGGPGDSSELTAPPPPPPPPVGDCVDGTDNDGDGKVDFPGDAGCSSASDPAEPDATAVTSALLTPFPIVRIVGSSRPGGGRVRLLAVRAPVGSTIELRCKGRGCPLRRQRKAVRAPKRVRFRRFERYFQAGVALGIYVRKPGLIGKYTRLRIRDGRRPARIDRCLLPGAPRPARCPAATQP